MSSKKHLDVSDDTKQKIISAIMNILDGHESVSAHGYEIIVSQTGHAVMCDPENRRATISKRSLDLLWKTVSE